jgi:hypothetical protein
MLIRRDDLIGWIIESIGIMDLTRAAAAAIFIGQLPHLYIASVAEFEASRLFLF